MGCGASNSAQAVSQSQRPVAISSPGAGSAVATASIVHKPVSLPKSYKHGTTITQGELNNQRTEFWSTRTEGNRVMWQAIRSAAEALLNEDVALANAILEASAISTPNGTLELCYDERGSKYKVPLYCYANPSELTFNAGASSSGNGGDALVAEELTELADMSENPEDLKNCVKLRVRINPGDHNLMIFIDPKHSIMQLKHTILREVTKNKPHLLPMEVERQRIMFMGKELGNTTKVGDSGFDDTKVVQVFLRPKPK